MRKPDILAVPKSILSLVAVLIALVFSVTAFSMQDCDGASTSTPLFLASEGQDCDQGCDEQASCSFVNTGMLPAVSQTHFASSYLPERQEGLQISHLLVVSHFNRAPPL